MKHYAFALLLNTQPSALTAWVQLAVQSGRYTEKENGAETKSSTPKPSLSGGKFVIKSQPKINSSAIN